jgi:eukaryotic-like serine/threonine-protein kinase
MAFTYVPLLPGRSLANGRFTVRQALSKGGMGAIYLASDNEAFGRMVVVKAMLDYFDPADVCAVQEARARFLQEARTLSLLRHSAIPQIFTYFQDGPHNYIVMEYQ